MQTKRSEVDWNDLLAEANKDLLDARKKLRASRDEACQLAWNARDAYRDGAEEDGRELATKLYNKARDVKVLRVEVEGCEQWAERCKLKAAEASA